MSRLWDNELWLMVGLVSLILFFTVVLSGCEDTTPPEMKYLAGPPVVEKMNVTGETWRLDAWALKSDSYPSFAAFGWDVHFVYETGDVFCGPGIHTTFTMTNCQHPAWSPVLRRTLYGSGPDPDDDSEGEDEVVGISANNGLTRFYLGLHDWPSLGNVANTISVVWQTRGLPRGTPVICGVSSYGQSAQSFYEGGGAWYCSNQDWLNLLGSNSALASMANSPPSPDYMPMSMDLNPTPPSPRVSLCDIPPALAECAFSEDYPPYSEGPNTSGEDILINTRWFQARGTDGGWCLFPASFVTPLPYDSNDVASIANTAWPYTVCFHAPAESAGMVFADAKLSVIDPNGSPVAATTTDIRIHEVGQCANCDGRLWRSDYVLLLDGSGGIVRVETVSGPVIVAWLPRGGYTLKIKPVIGARELSLFTARWLAFGGVLDINGDGIVNFGDYAAFRR